MLFRKKQPRACEFCEFGTKIDDGQILCPKKGVKSETDFCRKYSYDPCKRIPVKMKAPDFTKYSDADFSL